MLGDLAGLDPTRFRELSRRVELRANSSRTVGEGEVVLVESGELIVCKRGCLEGVFGPGEAFDAFGQAAGGEHRATAAIDAVCHVLSRADHDARVAERGVGEGCEERLHGIERRLRRETENFRRLRAAAEFLFDDDESQLHQRRPYVARVRSQIWPVEQSSFPLAPSLHRVPRLPSFFALQHLIDIGPAETNARFSFRQAALWTPVVRWRPLLPVVPPRIGWQLHAAWEDNVMALQISRELGNYPTRLGEVLHIDGGRRLVGLVDGDILFSGPNLQDERSVERTALPRWLRSLQGLAPEIPVQTYAWHQEPDNAALGPATGLVQAVWPVWGIRADQIEEAVETPVFPSPDLLDARAVGWPAPFVMDAFTRIHPGSEPHLGPIGAARRILRGLRSALS